MMVNDSVESMNILSCISECRVNAKIHGYGWLGGGVWGHHQAFVLRAPKWLVPALTPFYLFISYRMKSSIIVAYYILLSCAVQILVK